MDIEENLSFVCSLADMDANLLLTNAMSVHPAHLLDLLMLVPFDNGGISHLPHRTRLAVSIVLIAPKWLLAQEAQSWPRSTMIFFLSPGSLFGAVNAFLFLPLSMRPFSMLSWLLQNDIALAFLLHSASQNMRQIIGV